jgi:hypothetical protein
LAVKDFLSMTKESAYSKHQKAAMAVTESNCGDSYPALVQAVAQNLITEAGASAS